MRRLLSVTLCAAFALGGCSSANVVPGAGAVTAFAAHAVRNDIPPRLQWEANFGYCGETSFISAGLYYGQYLSQYEARAIASRGTPQNLARSQLLLGVNDVYAARRMHLNAVPWSTQRQRSVRDFEDWVVRNVGMGRAVVIGVFTNEYRFYGKTNASAGQATYDHIVPVVAATHDRLTFSDNGLLGPPTPYLFNRALATFARTRRGANGKSAPWYSLPDEGDYGIAIAGVTDPGGETLPVRVSTNVNYEKPEMRNGSTVRPKPMPLVLTVAVTGLRPGVAYRLYRYDDFNAVPDRNFNANAGRASKHWHIVIAAGSTYTVREQILSDRIAVYRAVPASGP